MQLKEYKLLSEEDKQKVINNVINLFINDLNNLEMISKLLDMPISTLRFIIKENNIKRTKEQIIAARKKFNLEHYGDENYCNSDKIKKSLAKSNFNFGANSQLKIAQKKLKEEGLYSWIILTDSQKIEFKVKIQDYFEKCLDNEEICKELKITNGCFKIICNEFNLKRNSKQHHELCKRKLKNQYGVENIYQLEKVKEKIKQNNLENYGVEYNWQRDDVKKSIKQTKLERYGDENYNNIEKIKQTNLEKYGAECPLSSEVIQLKRKVTNMEKYGSTSPFGNEIIRNKGLNTKLNRYGNKYYTDAKKGNYTKLVKYGKLQNVDKIKQTCLEKYGIEWPCQLPQCINKSNSISKINLRFKELLLNNGIINELEYTLKDVKYDFKINDTLVEINPTYTHNSTIGPQFNDKRLPAKDKNYHYNKSLLAKENGFHCIHVFDWDDKNKIINMLLPKQNLYARKCEIREVSKKECDEFLNIYHLQNSCRGQNIRVGLYYNNKLIQIMTFGKPRYNKNYEHELLRLCSHKDYKIVGGSERLFKWFLKTYNPKSIISYCDNAKFSGEVYKRLGMELKDYGQPSCNWSKGKERITQNLLNQRGFDQLFGTNYGKGTSNRDLMIKYKWFEVYDCGQSVYIYN